MGNASVPHKHIAKTLLLKLGKMTGMEDWNTGRNSVVEASKRTHISASYSIKLDHVQVEILNSFWKIRQKTVC